MNALLNIRVGLLILSTTVCGCTATYTQNNIIDLGSKLTKSRPIVIATPVDGYYMDQQYPNSGKMTATAVKSSFAMFATSTVVVPNCNTLECLKNSQPNDSSYYVIPEILHWEERATEWSGLPDKIEIKLSVNDGQNLKSIASTVISGKSCQSSSKS
jgi:hypothetical protein